MLNILQDEGIGHSSCESTAFGHSSTDGFTVRRWVRAQVWDPGPYGPWTEAVAVEA